MGGIEKLTAAVVVGKPSLLFFFLIFFFYFFILLKKKKDWNIVYVLFFSVKFEINFLSNV